jgi:hypothetical protein
MEMKFMEKSKRFSDTFENVEQVHGFVCLLFVSSFISLVLISPCRLLSIPFANPLILLCSSTGTVAPNTLHQYAHARTRGGETHGSDAYLRLDKAYWSELAACGRNSTAYSSSNTTTTQSRLTSFTPNPSI